MSDPTSAQQWNEVRTAFASSIMVDTALSSLAENLDGPEWPGANKVDCPADYIDLDYDDTVELLTSHGYPANSIEILITILQETLAFDDPFGDMVEHSESASAASNPILDNLKKLEIPEDFPIRFSSLSADTLEFCNLEKLETIGAFAVFAQGMSQSVIVGGDFRSLLNALSHVDETTIAKFLPFRPGQKGLHLVEALGATVDGMSSLQRQGIAARGAAVPLKVESRVEALVSYFKDDLAQIEARVADGVALSREVMSLQSPATEPLVVKLLEPHVAGAVPEKKSGWFGRLFGR
jgi:hypothetical protein